MRRSIRATIIEALDNYRGDNVERAKAAFRNMSSEEMDAEWGESGSTPRQILAGYEAHQQRIAAAIAWVNKQ